MKNRLHDILAAKRISQVQVYERTGISTHQLSNFANGNKGLSGPNLVKLADCLHVSIDYLLCRDRYAREMSNE